MYCPVTTQGNFLGVTNRTALFQHNNYTKQGVMGNLAVQNIINPARLEVIIPYLVNTYQTDRFL